MIYLSINTLSKIKEDPEYVTESAVFLKDESHGGEDVPIYASGPMGYLFEGTVEQSYVAHVMAYSSCIGPYDNAECIRERGVMTVASSSSILSCSSVIMLCFLILHKMFL